MTRLRCRRSPVSTLALLCLSTAACSVPGTVERLGEQSPAPVYGRPSWVQASARAGGWIGGAIGSAGAVALLPISWPLTELCGSSLRDESKEELLWFPATGLAAVGHAAFGAPADMFDYCFRRAWTGRADGDERGVWAEHAPLAEPALPKSPAAQGLVEADG